MIYHPKLTPTNERLREHVESRERDFPHTAMDVDLSIFPDRGTSWHWHEAFEFSTVAEGTVLLRTPQGEALLGPGDGGFVNANVLHSLQVAPGEAAGRLCVHLFRRELIAGTGLVGRRYVAPVENCAALERVILRCDEAEDRAILAELDAAFAAAEADDSGHEWKSPPTWRWPGGGCSIAWRMNCPGTVAFERRIRASRRCSASSTATSPKI